MFYALHTVQMIGRSDARMGSRPALSTFPKNINNNTNNRYILLLLLFSNQILRQQPKREQLKIKLRQLFICETQRGEAKKEKV